MRIRTWAVLAACVGVFALAPQAYARGGGGGGGGGHGGGGHGGGGHGGHGGKGGRGGVTVVYVPGQPGGMVLYVPPPTAIMPLEVTDAPVLNTEGVVALNEVIARHTVRAADAIVLDEPVHRSDRDIAAGTVLARVLYSDNGQTGATFELWCDMSTPEHGLVGASDTYACVTDPERSGSASQVWTATSNDAFFGYGGVESARWREKVTPARYHKAAPDERPRGQIGYAWCGGDGVTAPARFEVSGSFAGGAWTTSRAHACSFGARKGLDRSAVDGLQVQATAGPKPDTLAFKVEGRKPAVPIARLQPAGGVRSRAEADAETQAETLLLNAQPYLPTGAPPKPAQGAVLKGEALLTVDMKHGITGVLANDIWMGSYTTRAASPLSATPALSAGTPVYAHGLRVGDGKRQLVWCAPIRSVAGGYGSAACFPDDGVGRVWVSATPALMAGDLVMPSGGQPDYVTPPVVRRGEANLPALSLSYVFEGWTGTDNAQAQVGEQLGGQHIRSYVGSAATATSLASQVAIPGGVLTVKVDDADPVRVDVTFKPLAGSGTFKPAAGNSERSQGVGTGAS